MATVDVVHGLLPADQERPTVEDLEGHGIHATAIEVVQPAPGRYQLADETLHRDVVGARRGALLGAVSGFALGLIVALAVPDLVGEGVERLLTAAAAVAGFGALVGAMVGLQGQEGEDDDPVRWREVAPDDPVRCVTVHSEQSRNRAHRVLERHGAEFLESDRPA